MQFDILKKKFLKKLAIPKPDNKINKPQGGNSQGTKWSLVLTMSKN